jgi:cytoskeleton protein RodZ
VSVGESLVRARQERGLSVEDVSAATRIRGGLIRAIEADEFDACGGAVYARGHIRSIARVIGVEAEPLITEFDREHVGEVSAVVPSPTVDADAAARADRRAPNWTAAMVVVLVAVCIVAGVGLLTNNSHKATPGASHQGQVPVATTSSPPAPTQPVTPPPSAVAVLPSNVATALVRVTNDRTWLSVETLSGRLLFQGLLSTGQSKVFRDAKGLRIVIGNAPAVDLVADNHDIGAPKSSGNVAHVTVLPGGDVQYA